MSRPYVIDDPRPNAAAAPYTYFLPPDWELAAIQIGTLVKLTIRAVPPSLKWDAERMWVRVEEIDGDVMRGALDNEPRDNPGLRRGDNIEFERHHVISVAFEPDSAVHPFPEKPRRTYWERCLVDRCVLREGVVVGYLYREIGDLARDGDRYPDSGWRIRGDMRSCSGEEIDARAMDYVALGAVLNRDDSWLHLIDEPIGSAFERNFEAGGYRPSC